MHKNSTFSAVVFNGIIGVYVLLEKFAEDRRIYIVMRVNDSCAKCMYDRQCTKTDNKEYLSEIKKLLDNRPEDITSAELNMEFNRLHEKYIGELPDFKDEKKQFNDLVLSMESDLCKEIEASEAIDNADVILSKGQANFESFSGDGRHAFYTFLCKCQLFINRFQVPKFTGMLVEE